MKYREPRCSECKYQATLILWENGYNLQTKEIKYLPNYDRPLKCCTLFASDGIFQEHQVFGHTDPNHDGGCEGFIPRIEIEVDK